MNRLLYTLLILSLASTLFSQGPPTRQPGLMATPAILRAPSAYWQQRVSYTMDIDFDVAKHQFKGKQTLKYTNNSPDALHQVFYHLYYNAFQPNSMMDIRSRTISDPDSRVKDRIFHLKKTEIGYHKIHSLTMNGKPVEFEVVGTILEAQLPEPIQPRATVTFEMEWDSQVPIQIRRTGRMNKEGIDYSMTQWYPKMAEYDKDGWHANPYVGREFHGIWGDFDVTIHMDGKYVIAGTGILQNPNEIGHGYQEPGTKLNMPTGNKLHWNFKATNVHDFAWAADPDYQHDHISLNNGTKIRFFYQADTLEQNWKKLQPYAKKCFEFVNEKFGKYPYSEYSVIQGGDGGMEYPMCTLITAHGSMAGLVSVTVHESIHSWFQGLMATNESKYPWMDEGFTTYAQYMALDHLYEKKQLNPLGRVYMVYDQLANSSDQEPLTTHADHYKKNSTYGINSYYKGGVFLHQLSYIIGQEAFDRGMLDYYQKWRYKHPTPDDFKRVMEKASGLELDWYIEQWIGTVNTIDYGITGMEKNKKQTIIKLKKTGDMPMPLDIEITLKDGTVQNHYIPLRIMRGEKGLDGKKNVVTHEDWAWTFPTYDLTIDVKMKDIEKVKIDPTLRMADIHKEDNVYPTPNIKNE